MTRLYGFISRKYADSEWLANKLAWPIVICVIVVYMTVYLLFGPIGLYILTFLILFTIWLIIMLLTLHFIRNVYRYICKLFLDLRS